MRKKSERRFLFWLIAVLLLLLFSLIGPFFLRHDPYEVNLQLVTAAPCREYIMGTDYIGRCIFCRLVTGATRSVFTALLVVLLTFGIGTVVGGFCGYIGGRVDAVIMRFVDAFQAFPSLIFTIAVAAMLGSGLRNCVIAMTAVGWTTYARLARSEVMRIKEKTYVSAARISGMSRPMILIRTILPNSMTPLIAAAAMHVGEAILGFAGLSFLGLGTAPPYPEWGNMLNDGIATLQTAPWTVLFPGLAILLVVMLMGLFGDSVNKLLNPVEGKKRRTGFVRKGRRKKDEDRKTMGIIFMHSSACSHAFRMREYRGGRRE